MHTFVLCKIPNMATIWNCQWKDSKPVVFVTYVMSCCIYWVIKRYSLHFWLRGDEVYFKWGPSAEWHRVHEPIQACIPEVAKLSLSNSWCLINCGWWPILYSWVWNLEESHASAGNEASVVQNVGSNFMFAGNLACSWSDMGFIAPSFFYFQYWFLFSIYSLKCIT